MRVVIATDTLAPELSAIDSATALADGWRAGAPDTDVRAVPMAAGGPGTLDLLSALHDARAEVHTVPGADGSLRPTRLCEVTTGDGHRQVWVDAAEAIGSLAESGARAFVDGPVGAGPGEPSDIGPANGQGNTPGPRDDARADRLTTIATTGTSAGLAALLTAARGPREIVVTAGDLAAHDGGMGLLGALGGAEGDIGALLSSGGLAAGAIGAEHDDALEGVVARALRALEGARIRIAAATDEPLFGLHGANANLSRATGVDAYAAQNLESSLGAAFARLDRLRPAAFDRAGVVGSGAPLPLGGAAARRSGTSPGSGGAGGVAAMLEYLGGRIEAGGEIVAQSVGLDTAVDDADLVVTAVAVLDGSVLSHSVPAAVGRRAIERAIPVVALAREVRTSARELAPLGVAATYPISTARRGHLPPQQTPSELLAAARSRAERLALTWRL